MDPDVDEVEHQDEYENVNEEVELENVNSIDNN